ncbi:VCBS repeat-containing protein [Desulfurococcaceae archaeon MEX13E-LK6-19]|nr:VCBS repeat-containing protein [Desulfurococcaceae archaeon MEX13E-LK6-19]
MSCRVLSIVMLVILLSTIHVLITDTHEEHVLWPMYKYDAKRTGFWPGHNNVVYRGYNVSWVFEAELCVATSPVLANIDNDSLLEIIFGSCDEYVYCVDGRGMLEWKYKTGGGVSSPVIGDFDGDGVLEIGIGSSIGTFWILNAVNGTPEYTIQGSFTIAAPAVYDIDGDGIDEIIAGDVKGYLHIIDFDGINYIDKSVAIGDSLLFAPSIGDVNGDGYPEIIVGTSRSTGEYGLVKGVLAIVDPSTMTITRELVFSGEEVNGAIPLYDIDGDGVDEIIFTTKHSLYVLDVDSNETLLHVSFGNIIIDAAPSIGDFDNDGKPDIIVATTQGLYVYSLSGTLIFKFPFTKSVVSPIVGDIDGDGLNEVIVSDHDGKLLIIDYRNGVEYVLQTQGPLIAPAAIGDVDNDGLYEIIIGSRDFNLYCIKGILEPSPKTSSATQTSTTLTSTTSVTQENETSANTYSSPTTSSKYSYTYSQETTAGRQITNIPFPLIVLVASLIVIIMLAYMLTHKR